METLSEDLDRLHQENRKLNENQNKWFKINGQKIEYCNSKKYQVSTEIGNVSNEKIELMFKEIKNFLMRLILLLTNSQNNNWNMKMIDFIINYMNQFSQQTSQRIAMQQSDGNEIFIHIQNNADRYNIKSENEKNFNQPMIPDQVIESTTIKPKPLTFEQIELVSSTQVSGDGHVKSVRVQCPQCKEKVNTVIIRKAGTQTYLASCILLLCSFGLVCVSCLPCIIDDCKDVRHSCPTCKIPLGKTQFKILN
ncbi:unnamed protein product [Paramecium sonneborni]|uniref:LITAF domain-containing protein n=1 Tax=Paramecium sonneborni TaxID=65129 RepID=A0A8S1LQE4_9CILI|nr:unnamed protein product [Paramecium sonneborni]